MAPFFATERKFIYFLGMKELTLWYGNVGVLGEADYIVEPVGKLDDLLMGIL